MTDIMYLITIDILNSIAVFNDIFLDFNFAYLVTSLHPNIISIGVLQIKDQKQHTSIQVLISVGWTTKLCCNAKYEQYFRKLDIKETKHCQC